MELEFELLFTLSTFLFDVNDAIVTKLIEKLDYIDVKVQIDRTSVQSPSSVKHSNMLACKFTKKSYDVRYDFGQIP